MFVCVKSYAVALWHVAIRQSPLVSLGEQFVHHNKTITGELVVFDCPCAQEEKDAQALGSVRSTQANKMADLKAGSVRYLAPEDKDGKSKTGLSSPSTARLSTAHDPPDSTRKQSIGAPNCKARSLSRSCAILRNSTLLIVQLPDCRSHLISIPPAHHCSCAQRSITACWWQARGTL